MATAVRHNDHRPDFKSQRDELIRRHIRPVIKDSHVLNAVRVVPRERFVPQNLLDFAYEDTALPLEHGQTVSQPSLVAHMAALAGIGPQARVLEVGAGSGYAAALLGQLAREVFAIERLPALADKAGQLLHKLGYANIHILAGDGTKGLPTEAPFDAIVVSAAGFEVPPSLKQQLVIGGRLVIPVGEPGDVQRLTLIQRTGEKDFQASEHGRVYFVPLISDEDAPA